ncbi:UNVERIFIED_CONTAM: hypothetical protein Cloal_2736 [Acetivibrio alkalicellulosi]
MSDDLDKSIKQALDIISNPENLKGFLNILGNSSSSQTAENQTQSQPLADKTDEKSSFEGMGENLDLLRKVQDVVSTLNTRKDPRINLLSAITPFMNKKRQRAVNDCVQLLRVSQVLPLILNFNNKQK